MGYTHRQRRERTFMDMFGVLLKEWQSVHRDREEAFEFRRGVLRLVRARVDAERDAVAWGIAEDVVHPAARASAPELEAARNAILAICSRFVVDVEAGQVAFPPRPRDPVWDTPSVELPPPHGPKRSF